ncbi:cellulose synthase subunit BcsC-related outer membrane protein [Humitalea sp. 24SJ18S-53]|uniref:cellulose biosynthesis protein BcsC n=1 Tax=Humitalea sp. 24SJ18S-53 TaxID=3422307 RepID=UPI003D67B26C
MPLALLIGLPLAAQPATAQEQPRPAAGAEPAAPSAGAVNILVRQAERWLAQDRADLAATSIERALAADPTNPAALSVAARIEAARGNRDAAAATLNRLRAAGASDEQRAVAEQAVRGATIDRTQIEEARRLAREGRSAEAVARYRAAFGGGAPPDAFALEYYQTLAGTDAGVEEGRGGLARLAARPGATDRARLANAQALTFGPTTRAEGIRQLAELSARPDVAADARRAWRQALAWYGSDPVALPLLEAYMQRFPDDPEIRRRLEVARAAPPPAPPDPGADLRREGFARLDAGNLREGTQRFESALAANANDADALGGLGIIRLREGRNAEARQLLERAIAANPAQGAQWQRALDGASYGQELVDGRAALRRGDLDAADTILRRAAQRQVEDRTDVETLLGELALRRGDAPGAEQRFRAALARRPGFSPAATGLNQALRQQGRLAELVPVPRTASDESPATRQVNQLRAEAARAADPGVAAALLRSAMDLAPSNPWVRLDLARVLRREGRGAEGRALVDELATRDTSGGDAIYAAALLADEDGRPNEVDAWLSRVPPARRTPDMARLAGRARMQRDVASAVARFPSSAAESRRALLGIAARPDPTGATAAAVVRAFGEVGDTVGATEAVRVAQAANRGAGAGARLAVAGALLGTGQEAEAIAVMGSMDGLALTAEQRRDVEALRNGIAIRAADTLNEEGNQAQAFERLRPVLAADPQSVDAQLALGRLYQGARQPTEALRVAEGLLARDPRSIEARRAAVEALIAMGDRRRAEAQVAEAMSLTPRDSRVLLLEARVARAFGDDARAQRVLLAAASQRDAELGRSALVNPVGVAPGAGTMLAGTGVTLDNPFARSAARPMLPSVGLPQDRVAREIAEQLAQVRDETATRASLGIAGRSRSGTAGLDRLQEVAVPLSASISAGAIGGRFTANVLPVTINAGSLNTSSLQTAAGFGTNPLGYTQPVAPKDTTASGAGLGVAYRRGDAFSFDLGVSPLGYQTTNFVGGIELAPRITDNLRLRLTAERRSVTDSLLSWSGMTDPRSGTAWGGVARTGGRAQVELPLGPGYIYAGGGYATFDGQNVASNNRIEAGAGFSYPFFRSGNSELSSGVDLVYFAYDQNLRFFTVGQGGYYSPQSYAAINVPVDYRGRIGDVGYRLGATAGYVTWREDASQVFPNNPVLQQQLVQAAATNSQLVTSYPGQSVTGFIGGVRADLDYALTDSTSLAGQFSYNKAADWDETRVLFRLQNRF